jgi:hypothetical protein
MLRADPRRRAGADGGNPSTGSDRCDVVMSNAALDGDWPRYVFLRIAIFAVVRHQWKENRR